MTTSKEWERLTPEELARFRRPASSNPACPDCSARLVEGPHGGLSINWYCPGVLCGSRFNDMGALGVERISIARPHVVDIAAERDKLRNVLDEIVEALYPGGDRDHQWSPDTLDEIAYVLDRAGLIPE